MAEDTLARPPQPAIAPGGVVDWSRFRRDWLDDGDDCISSSFHEALRLTYGEDVPDVPEMEVAYRAFHPDWDDHASTMILADYWEALNSIGVRVEALHQRGDLVTEIHAELDAGRAPCCWVYLWGALEQRWYHHAIVAVGWDANRIAFWDQQRGIGWDYDADQFRRPGDGGSSGYAYVATYQPAELEPEPEPDQEADPVPLTMYLGPAPNLTQRDIDNTLFELTNIYHRMEKVPESPRKKQAELGIIAVKRALTGIE